MGLISRPVGREGLNDDVVLGSYSGADGNVGPVWCFPSLVQCDVALTQLRDLPPASFYCITHGKRTKSGISSLFNSTPTCLLHLLSGHFQCPVMDQNPMRTSSSRYWKPVLSYLKLRARGLWTMTPLMLSQISSEHGDLSTCTFLGRGHAEAVEPPKLRHTRVLSTLYNPSWKRWGTVDRAPRQLPSRKPFSFAAWICSLPWAPRAWLSLLAPRDVSSVDFLVCN